MNLAPVSSADTATDAQRYWRRWLRIFLQCVGYVSLLAFVAAVMPASWFIEASKGLGLEFADLPLTFYLARNLSTLYGFVALVLLVIATDLDRYLPLARYAAFGTLLLGTLQLVTDAQAGMPWWWTLGESVSTWIGGLLLWWLCRKSGA